jgi:hypothetical protein
MLGMLCIGADFEVEECIDTLAMRSCVEDADGCETPGGNEASLVKEGESASDLFFQLNYTLLFICNRIGGVSQGRGYPSKIWYTSIWYTSIWKGSGKTC